MRRRVELLYDDDCPNVAAARAALRRAFQEGKTAPEWIESSARTRGFGSPTILVDGVDVAGERSGAAPACRVYADVNGRLSGVPPVEQITTALSGRGKAGGPLRIAAALPGLGAALLPVLGCPACWPAYAAIVTALGLGFLLNQTYLLPITATLLALALSSFARGARNRHGYGPLAVGSLGVALILASKFAFPSDALWFLGLASLAFAAIWNAWPHGQRATGSCASCAASDSVNNDEQTHGMEVT